MVIPELDLADFAGGTAEQKENFVHTLGKSFEDVGFVAIKNSGIPAALIDQLYRYVQQFFSLPAAKKKHFELTQLANQRGYTSFGKEHAKGSDAPDLKEFFQFGQTVPPGHALKGEYPDNVPVDEIPGFNETLLSAYRAFEHSGKLILQAIALYLKLPQMYFDPFVDDGCSILRAIHYPPITTEPQSAIRAEQHEDINLITLLVGATADGLQILTKDGRWVDVTALADQIVVNVGDMLQRCTNNRLRSTTHRVVNPPRELWHTSRFSIPFFLHPQSSMSLAALPHCVDSRHPQAYENITAGEYLEERLKEIGLKK